MKNLILIILISLTFTSLAQETMDTVKVWKVDGLFQANFSQASFHNWATGGENNIALTGLFDANANYEREKSLWHNNLKLAYGKIKSGPQVRKSEDLMDLTSKVGYKKSEKIAYTLLLNFKSQFDKGYNYPDDTSVISKFLAPAFLTLAAGVDYTPTEKLSLFLSPLTAKWTYVNDIEEIDPERYGIDPDEKLRSEFGAYFRGKFEDEIMKNVNLATSLELFSNYLENPQNIDVNWEVLVGMKVNKYITASISTQLLYDDDITVPKKRDGVEYLGTGTQFKEVIAIGLAYKF